VVRADNLLEKVIEAIKEFYAYQLELDHALDNNPKAVILELSKWNNEHQRKAASVHFFVEEFISGLKKGEFTKTDGQLIAEKMNGIKEQESLLFKKVELIREKMMAEKKRIEDGQKALTHYSHTVTVGENTAYFSRDA